MLSTRIVAAARAKVTVRILISSSKFVFSSSGSPAVSERPIGFVPLPRSRFTLYGE